MSSQRPAHDPIAEAAHGISTARSESSGTGTNSASHSDRHALTPGSGAPWIAASNRCRTDSLRLPRDVPQKPEVKPAVEVHQTIRKDENPDEDEHRPADCVDHAGIALDALVDRPHAVVGQPHREKRH